MYGGEPRSASVETVTEVDLVAIAAADMRGLLAKNPEISLKLVSALTRQLRHGPVLLTCTGREMAARADLVDLLAPVDARSKLAGFACLHNGLVPRAFGSRIRGRL